MEQEPISFQLLALDGGGVRGLFSAAVLDHLEQDLKVNVAKHFDLLTGTSTGGIIALGLSLGLSPHKMVSFYIEHADRIFKRGWIKFPFAEQWHHIRRTKYDNQALIEVLKEVFGDATMADLQIPVVIPTFNLDGDSVRLFKTPHNRCLTRDGRIPVWQVALATSSAPTFLPASTVTDHQRLVDGGMWANNPVVVGIAEAISMLGAQPRAIQALNLGTMSQVTQRRDGLNRGGLWAWKQDATDVMLRAQSCGAFGLAQHLIGHERVTRIDAKVPPGVLSLDHLNERNLQSRAAEESQKFAPMFTAQFQPHLGRIRRPEMGWEAL